ncbi:MAG: nucleoside-diphosphate kinase [Myxococcales bacterium]|nr:nucleoside-diphosphate kinase [Myxococcales bacterium]MDH3484175.1 nucleoside-diphosphate kinase [Myxococcales bacterium]
MAVERTLSIIKPDAVEQNNIGNILAMIQGAGLEIIGMRMLQLSRAQAEGFYEVHRDRPFFGELVEFMTRGPVVVAALEGDNAVARYRTLMGATDPAEATEGTIRKAYGTDIGENACHGSDSVENGKIEVGYFFPEYVLR